MRDHIHVAPHFPEVGAMATSASAASLDARRGLRLLVANFFPAFHPPSSGGEQRYYYFYRYLSRYYDVTLLSHTYSHSTLEEVAISPTFREIRVPKEPVFDALHCQLDAEGIGPECSAYVVALASGLESRYSQQFATAVTAADVVVHEFPYTVPYDRSFGVDGRMRIYNAHNVEHRLARQMLRGEAGRRAVEFIQFLEDKLVRNAAQVFTTCEDDRRALASDFGVPEASIALAPNGFEPTVPRAAEQPRRGRVIAFMGSAHPPNVEAAQFVVEHVAPALPDAEFRIIGSVGGKLASRLPANVRRLGVLDDESKARELALCSVAINPMFSGSGTNLKALDYLAAGTPTLMTAVGARGLGVVDGETSLIAAADDFVTRLRAVLDDEPLLARVGAAGRALAYSKFTWERIADAAHEAIDAAIQRKVAKPARHLLLAVNDFPVSDAKGGGEVRIRELLCELSRDFDVVLLCLTGDSRRTERRVTQRFREIRIPKTLQHRDSEVAAARGEVISVADLVASEFCAANLEFLALFRALASRASAVVFEHPYLAPLVQFLPTDVPIVYSSLNVERRLKKDLLAERRDARARIEQAETLERRMLDRAQLVVCVSEADRREFMRGGLRAPALVVENGVRIEGRSAGAASGGGAGNAPRFAVFLGSAHPPNVEAARFLIDTLAPAIPSLDIVIAGGVCLGVGALPLPVNVHLVGSLPTAEKNALLARADLALNPLFGGGGSSLKVPDFLAAGLPLVSTVVGVRGYDLAGGVHYVEASRQDFVARTREVLHDSELRERLRSNAREYAWCRLDWSILGRRYRDAMRELVGMPRRPSILAVTFRFADPPPGGAETFLLNMLKELAKRGNAQVDVATCDVGAIVNHWHFSALFESAAGTATSPDELRNVFRFPVDRGDDGDFAKCKRLFACWMQEAREQSDDFCPGDGALLLGGWNFPEQRDGRTVRWTSRASRVARPATAKAMRLRGHVPRTTAVHVRVEGNVVATRKCRGDVDWLVDLPGEGKQIEIAVDAAFDAADDPRELGMLVDSLEFAKGTEWQRVPLDDDFESQARRVDVSRWVASLIDVTGRRDPSVDELFQEVRGPRSRALASWLEANVDDYDAVLAHGTPFSTAVLATDVAKRHGVRVVALPHLHMEDRYYHWRIYYDMFRAADRVAAAPNSAKPLFFDRIGAKSIAIPGGGVDPREFELARLSTGVAAFCALHRGRNPFVLVLGRKTAAKRYRIVIDAMTLLNAGRSSAVDVVLIGPDEDGQAVVDPNVYSYGAQPRDVVLGALSCAVCLVNMSESESFGIVLLESWLAGRPVIAARNCVAFADLVVSGENGFLVGSTEELASAVDTYCGNPDLADEHAAHGRAVAEGHAWARIAQEIEALLLGTTQPAPARDRSMEHAGARL